MTLKLMNPEELKRAYDTDLREAFPPAELKPLAAMEALRAKGIYDPLCLVDEDGTEVVYGMPGRCMMAVTTDGAIRKRAAELVARMEELE